MGLVAFIPVRFVLLAILGVVCEGFPQAMREGLVMMGRSDKTLKDFYQALSQHQFSTMDSLYEKGRKHLKSLQRILGDLRSLRDLSTSEHKLKKFLFIEMQILVEKMQRMFTTQDNDRE